MGDDKLWVRDNLQTVLGFAEQNTVEYILALGRRSSSAESLIDNLREFDVPINEQTRKFAQDLHQRAHKAPGIGSRGNAMQERERQLASLARQNQQYSIIKPPDKPKKVKKEKQEEKKKGHLKKKKASVLEEDDYEKDARERDAFAERVKKKG